MPFGLRKFAFSRARISLPNKQLMHLPLGLLHSREQEALDYHKYGGESFMKQSFYEDAVCGLKWGMERQVSDA